MEQIFLYQWGNNGETTSNPAKETIQHLAERKADLDVNSPTLKEDAIKFMQDYVARISINIPQWFVGTEDEFKTHVFNLKIVQPLQTEVAPFLVNYMARVEDLGANSHTIDTWDIKSILGSNGKVDNNKLSQLITNDKTPTYDKLVGIFRQYDEWLRCIDTGTEDSVKGLPSTNVDTLKLNITNLFEKEQSQRQIIWMSATGVQDDVFKLMHKYAAGPVAEPPSDD